MAILRNWSAAMAILQYWSAAMTETLKLIWAWTRTTQDIARKRWERNWLAATTKQKRNRAIFRLVHKWSRKCLKKKCLHAVIYLQEWTRQRLRTLKERKRHIQIQKQHDAASCIQRAFRNVMARVLLAQDNAILYKICLIQSLARRWLSNQENSIRCIAGLKLQSWIRMHLARNVISRLMATTTAVTVIQTSTRIYLAKRTALHQEMAAQKMQSTWRGYLVHQWMQWRMSCSAATLIQSCFRGFMAKRERDQALCLRMVDDVYKPGDKLGDGSFGVVFRATCRESHQVFAVKEVDTSGRDSFSDHSRRFLNREIQIMVSLRGCSDIVQLVDLFQGPYKTYIVMEECSGGNLQHQLDQNGFYEERQVHKILSSVFTAIDYMHQRGMVHCDIKPENVLLVNNNNNNYGTNTTVKLADFGLTQIMTSDSSLHTRWGTALYMAPEVWMAPFDGFPGYGERADMWSLGVMAYQLLGGSMPFSVNEPNAHMLTETTYNNKLRVAVCCGQLISMTTMFGAR